MFLNHFSHPRQPSGEKRLVYLQLGRGNNNANTKDTLQEELGLGESKRLDASQESTMKQIGELYTITDAEFRERYELEADEPIDREGKREELMQQFARGASDSALAVLGELQAREGTGDAIQDARNVLNALKGESGADTSETRYYDRLIKTVERMGLTAEDLKKTRDLAFEKMNTQAELDTVQAELNQMNLDINALKEEEAEAKKNAKEMRDKLKPWFTASGLALSAAAILATIPTTPLLGAVGVTTVIGGSLLARIALGVEKYPLLWAEYRRFGFGEFGKIRHTRMVNGTSVKVSEKELKTQQKEAEKAAKKASKQYETHEKKINLRKGDIDKKYTQLESDEKSQKQQLEKLSMYHASLELKEQRDGASPELTRQISASNAAIQEARAALARTEKAKEALKRVQRMFSINTDFASLRNRDELMNNIYRQHLNPELYETLIKMSAEQDKKSFAAQKAIGNTETSLVKEVIRAADNETKEQLTEFIQEIRDHKPVSKTVVEREFSKPGMEKIKELKRTQPKFYQLLLEISQLPPGNAYKTSVLNYLVEQFNLEEPAEEASTLPESLERLQDVPEPQKQVIVEVLNGLESRGTDALKKIFVGDNADKKCLSILNYFFKELQKQPWLRMQGGVPLSASRTDKLLRAVAQIHTYELAKQSDSNLDSIREVLRDDMLHSGRNIDQLINNITESIHQRGDVLPREYVNQAAENLYNRENNLHNYLGLISVNLLGNLLENPNAAARTVNEQELIMTIQDILTQPEFRAGDAAGRHRNEYLLPAALKAAEAARRGPVPTAVQRYCEMLKKHVLIENLNRAMAEQVVVDDEGKERSVAEFIADRPNGKHGIIGNPLHFARSIYANLNNPATITENQLRDAVLDVQDLTVFNIADYKVSGTAPNERLVFLSPDLWRSYLVDKIVDPATNDTRNLPPPGKEILDKLFDATKPDKVLAFAERCQRGSDISGQLQEFLRNKRDDSGAHLEDFEDWIDRVDANVLEQFDLFLDYILEQGAIENNELTFKEFTQIKARLEDAAYVDYKNAINAQMPEFKRIVHILDNSITIPDTVTNSGELENWMRDEATQTELRTLLRILRENIGPEDTCDYEVVGGSFHERAPAAAPAAPGAPRPRRQPRSLGDISWPSELWDTTPANKEKREVLNEITASLNEVDQALKTPNTLKEVGMIPHAAPVSADPFAPGPNNLANKIEVWGHNTSDAAAINAAGTPESPFTLAALHMQITNHGGAWKINNEDLINMDPSKLRVVHHNLEALKKQLGLTGGSVYAFVKTGGTVTEIGTDAGSAPAPVDVSLALFKVP